MTEQDLPTKDDLIKVAQLMLNRKLQRIRSMQSLYIPAGAQQKEVDNQTRRVYSWYQQTLRRINADN